MKDAISILSECGIQPTPQRIAVVECVMGPKGHKTAEEIFGDAKEKCPTVSRATVYNTLNLLVERRLITKQLLREGTVVFDSNIRRHHHFIDKETGDIYDIPWEQLDVKGIRKLKDFEVTEYQVVVRGSKKKRK